MALISHGFCDYFGIPYTWNCFLFPESKLQKKQSGLLTKKHSKTESSMFLNCSLSSTRKEEGDKSNKIKGVLAFPGLAEIKF